MFAASAISSMVVASIPRGKERGGGYQKLLACRLAFLPATSHVRRPLTD
jgi:hypothetical protein